ncbi:MAG TPA: GNAT family N-acetyltransferase [Devosiaceae bacterium]|nr:GNAT family N-acetyltransferase [Devosiaceae bacterium]
MGLTLEPPANDDDWRAFHDIREAVLFIGRGRIGVYDRNHPHDRAPQNQCLLLKLDGRPVGTVRLDDFGDGSGCLRLVAVTEREQRRGHGRALSDLCDARMRALGFHTLKVNAAPEAVGFYEKLGWKRQLWDATELAGIAGDCVQMVKGL